MRLSVYHGAHGEGWSEPIDYCSRCYPSLALAIATWGDEVDRDNEHPDYTLDEYHCESCGRQLTAQDD